jgi:gamma-glutamylcyclotransferase (GGCT)/AIG2-like uncharacterized protein YtfP
MFPPVWTRLVRGNYRAQVGTIDGFCRRCVVEEEYPAVIPMPGAGVEGVLYRDVDGADLQILDTFEGEYYQRQTVPVRLPGEAQPVMAELYVFRPAYYALVDAADWDVDSFREHGMARFLARYKGFC